jgi:hypothetical protein
MDTLINSNWLGVLIGIIGGAIITYVVAKIFHDRAKAESRLAYQYDSYTLLGIKKDLPDIQISFRGRSVPRITKSFVVVWNDGSTTLDGKQIVEDDPLRIVVSEGSEILDVATLKASRDAIKFSTVVSPKIPNEIRCNFEWLDPEDGALIQILHCGESKLGFAGIIRGLPKGLNYEGVISTRLESKRPMTRFDLVMSKLATLLSVTGVLLFVGFMLFLLGTVTVGGIKNYSLHKALSLFFITFGIVGIVGMLWFALKAFTSSQKRREPPETLRLRSDEL